MSDAGKRILVELVGPGGSGKTSLIKAMHADQAVPMLRIPGAKGASAILKGVGRARSAALAARLGPAETLNFARNGAMVEHGLAEVDAIDGLAVVDEGPMRSLRDLRCRSIAEQEQWLVYAAEVARRLAARFDRLVLVEITLDEEVRLNRYRERTQREAQAQARGSLRGRLGHFLDRRLDGEGRLPPPEEPVDRILDQICGDRLQRTSFALAADETAAQAGARLANDLMMPLARSAGRDLRR